MMHEVKRPKKPLIFYYVVVLIVLLLLNLLMVPWLAQRQVQEVDYGRHCHHRRQQRHCAGHQVGPRNDYSVRHER